MTLRKQAFVGVRWTAFSSLVRAALQFIQIAILARLLSHGDFGLIAVAIAILAILQIFSDAGVGNAIIHYQNITREQLSSLYWLNVSVSSILALLLSAFSYWVAAWYNQPVLQFILMLAAVTLFVGGLGQQIRVVAQRNMRFADLAKVELIAALCGFVVAVSLAWMGAGVYALAVGSLMTAVVGCGLVWVSLSEGWRPQARLRLGEIRQFIKFGAYMVGNNLANAINSQIDILLGGRLLGVQDIGLYGVPKDLSLRISNIINPIITQVGLPVMAKAQGDIVLLRRVYLQTMRMTASVNFPIYVALGLFAPEIVDLLLGSQWSDAIPVLRIFAIWALLRSTINPVGSLLISCGRPDLSFKWNVALLIVIPPAILVGSQFGVSGMAIAMAVSLGALAFWPNWFFLVRPLCAARLGEYSLQIAVPLILSIIAGLLGYFCAQLFNYATLRLAIGVSVGGFVYFAISWRFNRVWVDAIIELICGPNEKHSG